MKGKKDKSGIKYTCAFCDKERNRRDKTEVFYRGKWYFGCSECFAKSIDDPVKFDEKEF
jgi:predicted SprT family Zn-dependent metalloprotease